MCIYAYVYIIYENIKNIENGGEWRVLVNSFIYSGDVLEAMQFNAKDESIKKIKNRAPKIKKSSEKQYLRNLKNSRRHVARLVNANFAGNGVFLTLDYDNEFLPKTFEEAVHKLQLFLRRLRRLRKKLGLSALKYVAVTEQMSSENNRLHHHVIINPIDYKLVKGKWKEGGVCYEAMDRFRDYIDVANYISKEKNNQRRYKKKWLQSKNLIKPKVKFKIPKRVGDIKIPKGYKELSRELEATEYGVQIYVRAIKIDFSPQNRKIKKPKRGGSRI